MAQPSSGEKLLKGNPRISRHICEYAAVPDPQPDAQVSAASFGGHGSWQRKLFHSRRRWLLGLPAAALLAAGAWHRGRGGQPRGVLPRAAAEAAGSLRGEGALPTFSGLDEEKAVGIVWVGCFTSDDAEEMAADPSTSLSAGPRRKGFSTASCSTACAFAGFKYMALQDGGRCVCGDAYARRPQEQQVFDGSCGHVCASEHGLSPVRYCGTRSKNAVYQLHKIASAEETFHAAEAVGVADGDEDSLIGGWVFGNEHSQCFISRGEDGELTFSVPLPHGQTASGAFAPKGGGWLQADLTSSDGELVGSIRCRKMDREGRLESHFKYPGDSSWGRLTTARRVSTATRPSAQTEMAVAPAMPEASAEREAPILQWRVVTDHGLNVRRAPTTSSSILATKWQGSVVTGQRKGDWLHLTSEEGFMLVSDGTEVFLQPSAAAVEPTADAAAAASREEDEPATSLAPATTTVTVTPTEVDEASWAVVTASGLNVRAAPDVGSLVVGTKIQGAVVRGKKVGDWLKLTSEHGYMMIWDGREALMQLSEPARQSSTTVAPPSDVPSSWTAFPHYDLVDTPDADVVPEEDAKHFVEVERYWGYIVREDGLAHLKAAHGQTSADLKYMGEDSEAVFHVYTPPASPHALAPGNLTVEYCKEDCHKKPDALKCLKWRKGGCDSILDKQTCISSLDGRMELRRNGKKVHGQPCVWCGGSDCSDAGNMCEPFDSAVDDARWSSLDFEMASCEDSEQKKLMDNPGIFCYALMMPQGYEGGLLSAQLKQAVGIFACDGFAVFSNVTVPLGAWKGTGEKVSSVSIHGDLTVPYGGKWYTALNTGVFIRVWRAVVKHGGYARHGWTVKADPDCVFFPDRLRDVLRKDPMKSVALLQRNDPQTCDHCSLEGRDSESCNSRVRALQARGETCEDALAVAERPWPQDCGCACGATSCKEGSRLGAMFLVNCRFGLHGPIEVLSREAVRTFVDNVHQCQPLRKHPWGEDKYLDHCLQRLGVRRVLEFQLLSETACGQLPVQCDSSNVAFHPFKETQAFFDCWGLASKSHSSWKHFIGQKK